MAASTAQGRVTKAQSKAGDRARGRPHPPTPLARPRDPAAAAAAAPGRAQGRTGAWSLSRAPAGLGF